MNKYLIAVISVLTLFGNTAFAQEACETISILQKKYPEAAITQLTSEQDAAIRAYTIAHGNHIKDDIKTFSVGKAENAGEDGIAHVDPQRLSLAGYDDKGCLIAVSNFTLEQFYELIGGTPKPAGNIS